MKKILFLLPLFLLILLPSKVFALPTSVYEFKIDNYEFANTNQVLTFGDWLNSYTFKVEVLDNYIHNYYIIYLQSNNTDWLDLSLSGGCNVSCFASNSYIKKIGFINGFNYFAIVLPNGKADCGVGTGACILDNFVSVRGNDFGFTMQIIGVDAVEDDTIINNNYQSFLDLINTQNNNTNSIINNQNQNTQNIINNQNQNQSQTNLYLDNSNKIQQETNNYLKDDTPPSSDISALGNVQGLLPPGPVDSLLNIPFEFLSIVTTSCAGICVPLEGTFVFDSTLTIPCFNSFYDEVPEYLMYFINLIPSAFILIKYFKHLYKKVDRAVSMNSSADDEWGVL